MKITIEYEASWRNSFLNGSNNEPLPKNGRNFIASMTELKKNENYRSQSVTLDTVMGIMNRLVGEQRKLYQARADENYYFREIEAKVNFSDNPSVLNREIVYIRNMKKNTDQNSFTGMIKANDPVFQSDYSAEFWGVLAFDLNQLVEFIINDTATIPDIALDPVTILQRLENIKKMKPVAYEGRIEQASKILSEYFENYTPFNTKREQLILPMYCSALYLQVERLEKKFDMQTAKSRTGCISGISKNGFTPKDFMECYTTGKKKLIYGNPYIQERYEKGEGKISNILTKANGTLEIFLDIGLEQAKELKKMITYAGVSSFYLGKKGLAYVSEIRI